MERPDDPIIIATNTNYSTGTYAGQPTKVAPDSGLLANGHLPLEAPRPDMFNHVVHNHGQNLDWQRRVQPIAYFSLQNEVKAETFSFGLTIKSTFYRDEVGWLLLGSGVNARLIQVPEAGLYRVDFRALIDAADDTAYLETAITVADEVTIVGYAVGFRFEDNAVPAHVFGSALIPILDPENEPIAFSPVNGTTQTPQAEASIGRAHCIMVQRIGDIVL